MSRIETFLLFGFVEIAMSTSYYLPKEIQGMLKDIASFRRSLGSMTVVVCISGGWHSILSRSYFLSTRHGKSRGKEEKIQEQNEGQRGRQNVCPKREEATYWCYIFQLQTRVEAWGGCSLLILLLKPPTLGHHIIMGWMCRTMRGGGGRYDD